MTAQNPLDHQGTFAVSPLAELLVEICDAKLGGSIRLSHADTKVILYFRNGEVVYGVSNAREHRLLNVLLNQKKIEAPQLAGLPKHSNDVELAALLEREKVLSKDEVHDAIAAQIERILIDALSWPDGTWHFSPLVRSRDDLVFSVDVHRILIDYARCQPSANVLARFKSVKEKFQKIADPNLNSRLQSHEDFVLRRFGEVPRDIEDLTLECGLPENGFLQAIYVLWLGGMLRRLDWNATFSENRLNAIRNARIALVKQAQKTAAEKVQPPAASASAIEVEAATEPDAKQAEPEMPEISLEEYLTRAEAGKTHYDVLGVDAKAPTKDIKAAYFLLAKLFHPDRFHRESAATIQRVQAAFSSVQVAYETLKSSDTRENYDYKVRKELEVQEKLKAQGSSEAEAVSSRAGQALESFEVGLNLLMEDETEAAVPFLARAAHYNPENALYRAYYGKALSHDSKQRHKAEAELQAAAKLDPKNPKIRLMLVEFFVDNNLVKRAVGELNRFLELVPENREAKQMLAKLQDQATP